VLCQASSASAAYFSANADGWKVAASGESCVALLEYEGPGDTELALLKEGSGTFGLLITNRDWTAQKGKIYELEFMIGERLLSGPAVGTDVNGRKGFAAPLPVGAEQAVAAARDITIFMNKQLIRKLSLEGSSAALAQINRCHSVVRAEIAAAEREKQRWKNIPRDPFASAAGTDPRPKPRGKPEQEWWTDADYPIAARRENRSGPVEFELTIGSHGLVDSCKVVSSSGSEDLDQATCKTAQRRAWFDPCFDDKGQPITRTYRGRHEWVLPTTNSGAERTAADAEFTKLFNTWRNFRDD
jgi:TonB family protein